MSTWTSSQYYLSFVSSSISSSLNSLDGGKVKSLCNFNVSPFFQLSARDEEIFLVKSLPTQIVPNPDISQVVSNAEFRISEQINRQIQTVENRFKSINDEIESKILNASQTLDESLNVIDNTLSNMLNDSNLNNFANFDSLRKCFQDVDKLISKRNQNINDFMNVLRDLEKGRTVSIEGCYRQHMLCLRQLSGDSFERLYEKYLKDYNKIKLGNFRTYEDLRFKLVQFNEHLRHDFASKAIDVKSKIKNNIAQRYMDDFRNASEIIVSDKLLTCKTNSINLLNGLYELFDELTQKSEEQINVTFVLGCSDYLKTYSKKLDMIIDGMAPLRDEVFDEIQKLLLNTIEQFDRTITSSGESLNPGELAVVNKNVSTLAHGLREEKLKTISDVQLLLNDVKDTIKSIDTMLEPVLEMIRGHRRRSTDAKNVVLAALETKMKLNDSELNVYENNFNDALGMLVQASNETEVKKYEDECDDVLILIKNKIVANRKEELEIVSNYNDRMASELEVVRSEAETLLNNLIVPNDSKLTKIDDSTENELWMETIYTEITSFKKMAINFQNILYKRLTTFILEYEILDEFDLDNEFSLTESLICSVNERFNVGEQLLNSTRVKMHDVIAKRITEIEQHQSLLKRHMKTAEEASKRLKRKMKESYKLSNPKKNLIIKKVEFICDNVNELPTFEVTELISQLKEEIDSANKELNDKYKSHCKEVKSKYREIADSTLDIMKSIKPFSEGGNYGHDEAVGAVNVLKGLNKLLLAKQNNVVELLRQNTHESIAEIKNIWYSKMIKPVNVENIVHKKVLTEKINAINKLLDASIRQEYTNLYNKMVFLYEKLPFLEITFGNNDVAEVSKCWSEILSETQICIEFLLESYRDIKALLKPHIQNSVWNSQSEKPYIMSTIAANSKETFFKGKFQFYNYCKTVVCSETVDSPRFLNNIYMSIFHYVLESQNSAADLVLTESQVNAWINGNPETAQIYHEIMEKVIKKSKEIILQSELIWVFKLTDFFEFLNKLHKMERKFKNFVLTTYHEELVAELNATFNAFDHESDTVRNMLKSVREVLHSKLKPSLGHPNNVHILETLLADYLRLNSECSKLLLDMRSQTEASLEKIAEKYENQCPNDILNAATLFVECHLNLKNQIDQLNIIPAVNVSDSNQRLEAISDSLVTIIAEKRSIEDALKNININLQSEAIGTVTWPENKKLWSENVQTFSKLYRDRCDDVRTFDAVEKSKLVDWGTNFVRDVERLKDFHRHGCA